MMRLIFKEHEIEFLSHVLFFLLHIGYQYVIIKTVKKSVWRHEDEEI